MRFDLITNRKQAVEFGLRVCERFFDNEEPRWGIAESLPASLRLEAKSALELARGWFMAPNKQTRARVKNNCQFLQDAVDEGHEQLRPLLCTCASIVCRDWRNWVQNAAESAQSLLAAEFGPSSAGGVECECQAADLQQITGCRLSEISSIEDDDVEGLEEALIEEAAEALGLLIVTEGSYNGFKFQVSQGAERFLVTDDGRPVGWSPSQEYIEDVLAEIKAERDDQAKSLESSSQLELFVTDPLVAKIQPPTLSAVPI